MNTPLVLTLFTADPAQAQAADRAGVQRIGPDLEFLGKARRQGHTSAWVSHHTEADIAAIGAVLTQAQLFVRTNPMHPGLSQEIERYLAAGAQVLMLPMLKTVADAACFVDCVHGRAKVVLLIETPAAAVRLADIIQVPGVDEIHFGLNDLSLGLGLANHFELLTSDWMVQLAEIAQQSGLPWGFGGVGRVGDTHLPVSTDLVHAQYPRLQGSRALIARSFWVNQPELDWNHEVQQLQQAIQQWSQKNVVEWEHARRQLKAQALSLLGQAGMI